MNKMNNIRFDTLSQLYGKTDDYFSVLKKLNREKFDYIFNRDENRLISLQKTFYYEFQLKEFIAIHLDKIGAKSFKRLMAKCLFGSRLITHNVRASFKSLERAISSTDQELLHASQKKKLEELKKCIEDYPSKVE
jgi:hypothetical protein